MESQIDEKADAAEMVLDGHLPGENPTEVNLAELLDIAAKEFDETTQTIDESALEMRNSKCWPLAFPVRRVQDQMMHGRAYSERRRR